MTKTKKPSKALRSPLCRLAFVQLVSPNEDGKYKVVCIFDAEAQETPAYKALRKAASDAAKAKWGDKLPAKMKTPFKDAEDFVNDSGERYAGFEDGAICINATSKQKPKVVDRLVDPIVEPGDIYSGMFAYVSLNAFAYEVEGSKGVSFGLNNVQKVRDGERLGGGPTDPEDDFDQLDEAESEDGDDDIF